jgi:Fe-S-cluster containining protein
MLCHISGVFLLGRRQQPYQLITPKALTPVYDCMAGTNQSQPKCIALQGEVGREVSCSVYADRSSTCKEVQLGDAQCQKARLAQHLPPIVFHESSNDDLHHDQAS